MSGKPKGGGSNPPGVPGDQNETLRSPESWEQAAQEQWNDASVFFEDQFIKTGNPIYVCKMIRAVLSATMTKSCGHMELKFDQIAPLPVPSWCVIYLLSVSAKILALSRHLDPDDIPNTQDHNKISKWMEENYISSSKALDLIPAALGFLRDGSNAFRDNELRNKKLWDLEDYNFLISQGLSNSQAIAKLIDVWGVSDERSVKRRIAAARKEKTLPF